MYTIGYDIGSSSIKAALIETDSGKSIGLIHEPKSEMEITSIQNGWAEQNPDTWWRHLCKATQRLIENHNIDPEKITGIGIAYQMHGLVIIDDSGKPLRDSIIWCDSRAVEIGQKAFDTLGNHKCEEQLLNSPANFTASKLRWVKENEPEVYSKIYKFMLPGDYIAYKLSGKVCTTLSGLSEGVLWDFKNKKTAYWLLEHYEIDKNLVPDIINTFGVQGKVSSEAAKSSGLAEGTPIYYRAGDQPNNALSLNALNPGEVAATGGTSGVIYAVTENLSIKEGLRVNNFAHVNHSAKNTRIGKLLCINGAGIQYRWLRNNLKVSSYEEMNELANAAPVGSKGVTIHPFGNGAERMLKNKNIGTQIGNLNLNIHHRGHLCRAALEGIAFSFVYGLKIMTSDGVTPKVIKAGNDNLFQSKTFSSTIATLTGLEIEIYNTTGAIGAARACQLRHGNFKQLAEQVSQYDYVTRFKPVQAKEAYEKAYRKWERELEQLLNK